MNEMTVKRFDSLKSRDFENGAVRDEIRATLKAYEKLVELLDLMGERFLDMANDIEKWKKDIE